MPIEHEFFESIDIPKAETIDMILVRQQIMLKALEAAQDALETLRRGHGVDVSTACYPALNLVRDAVSLCKTPNRY